MTAAILAASLALIAAACGDDDDGGAPAGGATATTRGELGEATTAIEVRVPTTPRYVRGADGKVHLEFDLITTNVLFAPVTVASLAVRDGDRDESVISELTYTMADDALFRTVVKDLAVSSAIEVPRLEPIEIQAPLRGDGWWSFNACCTPNAHRNFLLASGGTVHSVEMFAIDWVQLVDGQRLGWWQRHRQGLA